MVTLIHGGHREGLCFEAYKTFKLLLDENEIEVNAFSLRDLNFQFCCGDQPCQDSGTCIYKDAMTDEILPVIADSDALIFFTPTYFNMPPAILTNFIDRCNLLLTNEERKHPRFGAWISGQTERASLEDNYKCLATFAEICELKPLMAGEIIRVESDISSKQLNADDLGKLQKLAKEISTLR